MLKKNAEGVGTEVVETPVEGEVINQEAVDAVVAESVAEAKEEISDAVFNKFMGKLNTAIKSGEKTVVNRGAETRAFLKAIASGDRSYFKGMNATNDVDGAYIVPTELSSEVLRIEAAGYGVARQEMRYLPFGGSGDTRIIPKLNSSVSVFWTLEGGKKGGTKAQFGVVTQILKKLTGIVPITEELIEDSNIDIVKLVAELFVEAVAIEEDLQYFDGDGTVWTGLLRTASIPALAIASGSTFASVTADDLLKLQSKVKKAARTRGKYYMSTSIIDLVRTFKGADGQYIWKDSPSAGGLSTLWGKPVVEVEAMPSTDLTNPQQANKHFVLFGDMKLGAIYGDKGEVRVKMLSEATITDADGTTQINLAEQDMIGVRMVKRTGYVVANEQALARLKTNAS